MMLAAVLVAAMQLSGDFVLGTFSSYVLGQQWDFIVRKDDLDQSPPWSELIDDPPLPARSAIYAAQLLLDRLVSNAREWRLNGVRLNQIGRPDGWVYIVEFTEPPPSPLGGLVSRMGIVVLMTGGAVEPQRSPLPPHPPQ